MHDVVVPLVFDRLHISVRDAARLVSLPMALMRAPPPPKFSPATESRSPHDGPSGSTGRMSCRALSSPPFFDDSRGRQRAWPLAAGSKQVSVTIPRKTPPNGEVVTAPGGKGRGGARRKCPSHHHMTCGSDQPRWVKRRALIHTPSLHHQKGKVVVTQGDDAHAGIRHGEGGAREELIADPANRVVIVVFAGPGRPSKGAGLRRQLVRQMRGRDGK